MWRNKWQKLPSKIKAKLLPPVSSKGFPAFTGWVNSSLNAKLLFEDERRATSHMIELLQGGYHFMVMGPTITPSLIEDSRHSHNFHVGSIENNLCQVKANFDELPLPSDIVDATIMHHVLEFSESAHRVLNETTRVLSPGGYLIIITFNPLSLYGLYSALLRLFSSNPLWQRHFLRKSRLMDWLKLLHMQPEAYCTTGYLLPKKLFGKKQLHKWVKAARENQLLPFGACQVILAKKVVSRPISPGKVAWSVLPVSDKTPVKSSSHQNEHKKGQTFERR